jgi:hypothetical protein
LAAARYTACNVSHAYIRNSRIAVGSGAFYAVCHSSHITAARKGVFYGVHPEVSGEQKPELRVEFGGKTMH